MNPDRIAQESQRRLSLVDLMLIVAAASVWMAVMRDWEKRGNSDDWGLSSYRDLLAMLRFQLGWLLMIASVTMLVIRLRGRRPRRRRLWRQPGLAASAGATLGILVGFAGSLAKWTVSANPQLWLAHISQFFFEARPFVAPGVLGAWLALSLTGRWRSERSAIDRLGRLLGLLWLLEFAVAEMPGFNFISILEGFSRRGAS
jgi:hypothetical protein